MFICGSIVVFLGGLGALAVQCLVLSASIDRGNVSDTFPGSIMKRLLRNASIVMVLAAATSAVFAQSHPTRPVRFVVPAAAGGGVDGFTRILAQRLTEQWGRQVVVENRAGAGGNIAMDLVAKSAPDGHTYLTVSQSFAVNASLYPSAGMTRHLAEVGQFPTAFGRNVGKRAPVGLVVMALITIFMIIALDLNSIASLGSAVALLIFSAVTVSHFKTYKETGANLIVLIIALVATLGTLVVFTMTTLVNEPKTAIALLVILAAAVLFDVIWKRLRDRGKARYARHPDTQVE